MQTLNNIKQTKNDIIVLKFTIDGLKISTQAHKRGREKKNMFLSS